MKTRLSLVLLLVLALPGLPRCTGQETATQQAKLDISSVTQLLDVLNLLIAKNPEYTPTLARLRKLPGPVAFKELDTLASRNASDPEIKAAIDRLLDSPAYRLYYKQFRNVTPDIHRKVLCALPYWGINSPADIGSSLYELCWNLDSVRTWVTNVVSRIDLNKSQQIALQWLPPGDYTAPTIHFFYDGNGDAFAFSGEVGMDLYGTVFGRRPLETRFRNLGEVGVERIELILAHELHHVYSAEYLYPPSRQYANWREQWKDRLIRQIINEGVAMQCDVRPSFRRTMMEDTTVVRFWIGHLNEKLAALRADSITEPQMQTWYENSFHETARTLLNEYRKRTAPAEDSATYMRQHIFDRPSMVYTLGWWMTGRILEGGKNTDRVIALLSNPSDIYKEYDESVAGADSTLKVKF